MESLHPIGEPLNESLHRADTQPLRPRAKGEPPATSGFSPHAYDQLRRRAVRIVGNGPMPVDLQATALVHEAWIKVASAGPRQWKHRTHFLRSFECVMRSILTDRVRSRRSIKRGGLAERLSLENVHATAKESDEAVLTSVALQEALAQLEARSESLHRMAQMRIYEGLSQDEIARALGVTTRTVERGCREVRRLLRRALDQRE